MTPPYRMGLTQDPANIFGDLRRFVPRRFRRILPSLAIYVNSRVVFPLTCGTNSVIQRGIFAIFGALRRPELDHFGSSRVLVAPRGVRTELVSKNTFEG